MRARGIPTLRGQLNRLLLVAVGAVVVLGLGAVLSLHQISRDLSAFDQELTPLVDGAADMRADMAAAQAVYRGYLIDPSPDVLVWFNKREDAVRTDQADVARYGRGYIPAEDLEATFTAQDRWFAEARAMIRQREDGRSWTIERSSRLFESVTTAQDDLRATILAERAEHTSGYRRLLLVSQLGTVGLALLCLAIGVTVSRRLSRRISRPIQEVAGAAIRLAQGDIDTRVRPSRASQEVAALAASFNTMAASHQSHEQERNRSFSLHELTGHVATALAGAGSDQTGWSRACRLIGEGLGLDRVVLLRRGELPGEHHRLGEWDAPGSTFGPDLDRLAVESRSGDAGGPPRRQAPLVASGSQDLAQTFGPRTAAVAEQAGVVSWYVGQLALPDQVLGHLVMVSSRPMVWDLPTRGAADRWASLAASIVAEGSVVEELRRLDQQKSEFMATTSHELRTPLTSIAGYLEMLADGDLGDLTAPQERAFAVIDRNVRRLRVLIEDQLMLNRLDSGRAQTVREQVDVGDELHRVLENLLPQATDAGVTLVTTTLESGLRMMGDRDQVGRALVNVVGNAIKFSPRGSIVELSATRAGEHVRIVCRDFGMGIPAAELEHLFTRFYRASNATARAIQGSGLGLAIVRAVTEAHGGDVQVVSREGEGTTVTLTFAMSGRPVSSAHA
ncbi:HAMP domain-containing protein [Nocardioides rotundus]|uniref:HAMP domain-containing sensor histidine kinase n=1 Tax=Nocardioides rotundus TaxID=1774216 RepID=UPI001CBFF834|nr:ATP-binding protein [Nocardioides rotundus]UAL29222.1 HAMP domain-containing protein [Nocardioides rotundus]